MLKMYKLNFTVDDYLNEFQILYLNVTKLICIKHKYLTY